MSQIGCIGDHRENGSVVIPWCIPAVFSWQCVDRYRTDGVGFVVGWAACSGVMVVGLPMQVQAEGVRKRGVGVLHYVVARSWGHR